MSQNSLVLPTTGTVSGTELVTLVNQALDTLNTAWSGASAPSAPEAYQGWLDTSTAPPTLRIYDGASWVAIAQLDTTNHLWLPPLGGGAGTIASASSCDLGSQPQSYLSITGTTTIANFGASMKVGQIKAVSFAGALTLTNGVNLILPGGANILTAAGDMALVTCTAAGTPNTCSVIYRPASGKSVSGIIGGSHSATTPYSFATTDDGILQYCTSGASVFNLPSAPRIGYVAAIMSIGYQVTINASGSDFFQFGNGADPTSVAFTATAYEMIVLIYRGGVWLPLYMTPSIAASLGLTSAAFTKSYTSSQQTITAGGSLTLAHGLGAQPKLIVIKLHCLTAENGYSVGDELIVPPGFVTDSNGSGRNCGVVPDATNLNVRFGSSTTYTFLIGSKSTGVPAGATNTNWAAIFEAFA
ncbi:MAG TPA: hypothetical protein VMF53_15960 [Alphaproteobacteria bacterium]|nr:hypothetical protein [Alphaproteobacteria bacterium]